MKSGRKSGSLRAVVLGVRAVLFGVLFAIAKAFGGHPKIPDPIKRNQVTQVDLKR